jgi:hypothetical protein
LTAKGIRKRKRKGNGKEVIRKKKGNETNGKRKEKEVCNSIPEH